MSKTITNFRDIDNLKKLSTKTKFTKEDDENLKSRPSINVAANSVAFKPALSTTNSSVKETSYSPSVNTNTNYSFNSYKPNTNFTFEEYKPQKETEIKTKRVNFAEYPIEEQGNMLNSLKNKGRLSAKEYDEDLGKILKQYNDNINKSMYYDLFDDEYDENKRIKTIPRETNDGYENELLYPSINSFDKLNSKKEKSDGAKQRNLQGLINLNQEPVNDNNILENEVELNPYGFDNQVISIMDKLKANIKEKNPSYSKDQVEYEYQNILGSFVYKDNSLKTIAWNITAGNAEKGKDNLNSEMSLARYYGLTQSEEDILEYNIRLQNQMSGVIGGTDYYEEIKGQDNGEKNLEFYQGKYATAYGLDNLTADEFKLIWDNYVDQYSNQSDFAHQSITTATMLATDTKNKNPLAYIAPDDYREDMAGWRGDATLGFSPTLGADDYMADLDAENIMYIARRDNIDYATAAYRYTSMLEDGMTRAEIFKSHTDIEEVKHAIFAANGLYQNMNYQTPNYSMMEELKQISSDAYNFILNLERENHELQNYVGDGNERSITKVKPK